MATAKGTVRMRWSGHNNNEVRIISVFPILPKHIDGEWFWLERYWKIERYTAPDWITMCGTWTHLEYAKSLAEAKVWCIDHGHKNV